MIVITLKLLEVNVPVQTAEDEKLNFQLKPPPANVRADANQKGSTLIGILVLENAGPMHIWN